MQPFQTLTVKKSPQLLLCDGSTAPPNSWPHLHVPMLPAVDPGGALSIPHDWGTLSTKLSRWPHAFLGKGSGPVHAIRFCPRAG
jgi:hypothetical protein